MGHLCSVLEAQAEVGMSTQGQEGAGTERQAGARQVRSLNVSVTQNDAKNPGSHRPEILAPLPEPAPF